MFYPFRYYSCSLHKESYGCNGNTCTDMHSMLRGFNKVFTKAAITPGSTDPTLICPAGFARERQIGFSTPSDHFKQNQKGRRRERETLKPLPSSSDGGLASVSEESPGSRRSRCSPIKTGFIVPHLCGDFPLYLISNICYLIFSHFIFSSYFIIPTSYFIVSSVFGLFFEKGRLQRAIG